MIKYYVRTTEDRKFKYDLEYITIIDKEHKPVDSFIKSLYEISESDSVLLEDDLVLCNNFKNTIEEVIKQYPNDIIQFFDRPSKFYTTHYSEDFNYNQCTYYPKGISKIIADKMVKLKEIYRADGYDTLERRALKSLRILFISYRPTLVQHKDNNTLIQRFTNHQRNTIYFKNYLDKLGISLLDSFKLDNYNKLEKMLEEDRKKWSME